MRYRVAGWRPSAAIGAAGFMAGLMLAAGIGGAGALASVPFASAGVTNSQPPAPGPNVTQATLMSVDIPVNPPPRLGPKTVVVIQHGDGPGPEAIVVIDHPGPAPGPRAVVISGGDPPDSGPKVVART